MTCGLEPQTPSNIYHGKEEFIKIYERNLELEREIKERTKELDVANQRMLSLQNILDMMNSAKPLRNVLETVVNSIQGELGYLHCTILRKELDSNGEYVTIIAESDDLVIQRINEIIGEPLHSQKLAYSKNGIFFNTLENKKIVRSTDIGASIKALLPNIEKTKLEEILSDKSIRSIITMPIFAREIPFGIFAVFSSREDFAKSETDFLSMYIRQIELAITIADLFEKVKTHFRNKYKYISSK